MHEASAPDEKLPKAAIRPYPQQYVSNWQTKSEEAVVIRPIRPEDEPKVVEFHKELSERSVYMRYREPLQLSQRTAHDRLTRICFIDYNREMALVVERSNAAGDKQIIAVGRMGKLAGVAEAELAVVVRDEFQGQELGKELYRRLLQVARDDKLTKVHSNMLSENLRGKAMCSTLGFTLSESDRTDNLILATLVL